MSKYAKLCHVQNSYIKRKSQYDDYQIKVILYNLLTRV